MLAVVVVVAGVVVRVEVDIFTIMTRIVVLASPSASVRPLATSAVPLAVPSAP